VKEESSQRGFWEFSRRDDPRSHSGVKNPSLGHSALVEGVEVATVVDCRILPGDLHPPNSFG
jgi:hypothetical protein